MVESEHVVLAQDNSRPSFEDDCGFDFSPVDVAKRVWLRTQGHHTIDIFKDAMLAEYMRSTQLDILQGREKDWKIKVQLGKEIGPEKRFMSEVRVLKHTKISSVIKIW